MKRKFFLALLGISALICMAVLPAEGNENAAEEYNLYADEDTEGNRYTDLTDEILKPNNRKNQDLFLTDDALWTTSVNQYTGIQNGYFTIDGGGHTVTAMQNIGIGIGSKVILKNITVDLNGYRFTLRHAGYFELAEGAEIINGDNAAAGCISIEGDASSTFVMRDGSSVKGCGKSSQVASAVYIHDSGNFVFEGGVIETVNGNVPAVRLNGSSSKIEVSGSAAIVPGEDGARSEISLKNGEQFTLTGDFAGDITLSLSEIGVPFGKISDGAAGYDKLKCMGKPEAICIAKDGVLVWATDGECYIGGNMYERLSLPEAVAKAKSGSTIHLLKDVVLDASITLNRIGEAITIDSDGEMKTISINIEKDENIKTAAKRLFIIRNGNLTLENVALKGGMHKDYGGLAVVEEASCSLTLKGTTRLSGGKASYGGAVWVRRGTLTVSEDALIEDCEAEVGGGAIYITNSGTVNLLGGTVKNNSAPVQGGIKALSGSKIFIENNAEVYGNKDGSGKESNIVPEDKNTVVLKGTFTGKAGVSFGGASEAFGLSYANDGEYNIFSDSGSGLYGYVSDGLLVWIPGKVKLSMEADTGTIALSGAKYGVIRFITHFETVQDSDIISYGTYVLPSEIFNENENEIYNKGGETLTAYFLGRTKESPAWHIPQSGYSFAVDYVKIPEEHFDTAFVAVSYVNIGGTYIYKKLADITVNSVTDGETGAVKELNNA